MRIVAASTAAVWSSAVGSPSIDRLTEGGDGQQWLGHAGRGGRGDRHAGGRRSAASGHRPDRCRPGLQVGAQHLDVLGLEGRVDGQGLARRGGGGAGGRGRRFGRRGAAVVAAPPSARARANGTRSRRRRTAARTLPVRPGRMVHPAAGITGHDRGVQAAATRSSRSISRRRTSSTPRWMPRACPGRTGTSSTTTATPACASRTTRWR